jgi:hypothetical protein
MHYRWFFFSRYLLLFLKIFFGFINIIQSLTNEDFFKTNQGYFEETNQDLCQKVKKNKLIMVILKKIIYQFFFMDFILPIFLNKAEKYITIKVVSPIFKK